MTAVSSKRALFARFRGGPPQIRPPWALAEEVFVDACTRCGKCVEACPAQLLVKGHGGFPIVSFERASCSFCKACAEACEAGCFAPQPGLPWQLHAAISGACVESKGVTCRMCEEACEPSAIRFRPKLGGGATVLVSLSDCSGCGACVAACPVLAISIVSPSQPSNQSGEVRA